MDPAAAIPFETFPPQPRHWLQWLRREMAPFPNRGLSTIRITAVVALVVVISMTLRVPNVLVSAYLIFFITRENEVVTTKSGVAMMIGAAFAIAISLLLYRFTYNFPEWRIPLMAVVLFIGFYLSRILALGPLTFGAAFVISGLQSLEEVMPNAEYLVHWALWLWVSAVYPIGLAVLANRFFLPARHHDALLRELERRMTATTVVIKQQQGKLSMPEKLRAAYRKLAARDTSSLFTLLTLAEAADPSLKQHHEGQSAVIIATERLVTAAAAWFRSGRRILEDADRPCVEGLLAEAKALRPFLRCPDRPLPPGRVNPTPAAQSEIRELQLAMCSLRLAMEGRKTLCDEGSPARQTMLADDAFSNPAHIYYGLKVTLATMACYILYTALDWPGPHTAFVTCCFISLESIGSTVRKGVLRVTGCLIGGLIGFLSIMYVMPHMESIVSLLLLVAAVSCFAAWVASGSERIAYAGLQIALAFFMCVLQSFAPDTDFHRIRDRIAGILLGIAVTTLVFCCVWPERASDRLRNLLAQTLRDLGDLIHLPQSAVPLKSTLAKAEKLRGVITTHLEQIFRLAESAAFEENNLSKSIEIMRTIASRAEGILLTATLLTGKTEIEEWNTLPKPVQSADRELRISAGFYLVALASHIENGMLSENNDFIIPPVTAYCQVLSGQRSALLSQLVEQIEQLA